MKKNYGRIPEVSREAAREIIVSNEPALTKEIVSKYTDSELKEWMKLLGFNTSF